MWQPGMPGGPGPGGPGWGAWPIQQSNYQNVPHQEGEKAPLLFLISLNHLDICRHEIILYKSEVVEEVLSNFVCLTDMVASHGLSATAVILECTLISLFLSLFDNLAFLIVLQLIGPTWPNSG